ncbi:UDP-glycosyltransferase 74G1-like [Abrus precatorius]|uniref:Glycosyltransferase n=1 Tax=Abrus precatorius TaxID=3816 RepID=A0A8B8L9L8_ABRPR|nr:UDP-glycosyltransferase 74G1-like [Abrus precatorius]
MEKKERSTGSSRMHCLVLPFPAAGHMNPMLQFSKLLQHQGVRITLVTPHSFSKNFPTLPNWLTLQTISDGFDSGGLEEAGTYPAYIDRFEQVGPDNLVRLIQKLVGRSDPVDCVIYDSSLPWALESAKRLGLFAAVYITQSMAVNTLFYNVHLGQLRVPLTEEEISLPALPKLKLDDMPSVFFSLPYFLYRLVDQFSNIHKADWIFCNTFYELENQVVDWMTKNWPQFRTIGPNVPSKDDQDYGAVQFASDDDKCMEWLDDKPKGSVVYVSFGTTVPLDEEQMKELAWALRICDNHFFWVVRASEETKLPKDFAKKSEKGLVVKWCSQPKVLAHEAIGCFVTHCGWNSTLEALCLGIPTIAVPLMADQITNAKFIADVWKVGLKAPFDEKKIARQGALKHCISKVMDCEEGKEIKNNLIQFKTLAAKAMDEGGSTQKNIGEFVNSLLQL